MKTTTIPPLRVSAELRSEVEQLLEAGETLSGFVVDAVNRSVEYRKYRREFIARGLASADRARTTGEYVPAAKVIEKLAGRLRRARRRAA